MDIVKTLETLEKLVNLVGKQASQDRLTTYAAIKKLMADIEDYARGSEENGEPVPNIELYLTEMMAHLECLAGLDDLTSQRVN